MVSSIINVPLQNKREEHNTYYCTVEKAIELPVSQYEHFKHNLLLDYDFIADNTDAMYTDDSNVRHCLLVLNKNGEDGIIVYSAGHAFATYSAHIPYAREIYRLIQYPELDEFNSYMERIVDKYVQQAKSSNQNGLYRLLVDDIRSAFGDSMFNENVFLNVMQTRPEFEYVEFDGEEFFFKLKYEHVNSVEAEHNMLKDANRGIQDMNTWKQYINYLTDWVKEHQSEKFKGMTPASFNEWENNEYLEDTDICEYPQGTRIELNFMDDPFHPVPSGTRGTVKHVDDQGQLHMLWDNGRTLAVVPGVDSFRKLTQDEIMDELREQGRVVNLGDECEIVLPEEPIDCSSMTYFDNLEHDCWDLVEKYCEHLGIQMLREDGESVVSFDIAKDIQERILEALEDAGVELIYEQQHTENSGMIMGGM